MDDDVGDNKGMGALYKARKRQGVPKMSTTHPNQERDGSASWRCDSTCPKALPITPIMRIPVPLCIAVSYAPEFSPKPGQSVGCDHPSSPGEHIREAYASQTILCVRYLVLK